eukprot:1158129-Pelagomonas_calceolata.AAC.8
MAPTEHNNIPIRSMLMLHPPADGRLAKEVASLAVWLLTVEGLPSPDAVPHLGFSSRGLSSDLGCRVLKNSSIGGEHYCPTAEGFADTITGTLAYGMIMMMKWNEESEKPHERIHVSMCSTIHHRTSMK